MLILLLQFFNGDVNYSYNDDNVHSRKQRTEMANSTLRKRFKEAQKVNFPGVEESSNTFIHDFIKAHCDAIGCPREFLFFPFLSTFAGMFDKYFY